MLLKVAVILFVVAALFGLKILTAILKNSPTPKLVVFLHGPIAATALIIVIYYLINDHTSPLLLTSVTLFILAALGGLTLFVIDMKGKPIPKAVALVHPLVAASGLVTLVLYMLQQAG